MIPTSVARPPLATGWLSCSSYSTWYTGTSGDIGGFRMGKAQTSISTRTQEFTPRELPLKVPEDPPRPAPRPPQRPADRIKEALLRWLEEEM
ncbi:hypothetical protein Anae109_1985 [Anaeromyxobacter sp. Fw109-5]|nr:hypothetical protein Anae109_1985 [Anaeromyxobacter sp. Fw109-5]